MPQINDYSSQVDAQGAVGGVTPNLEAVSLFGRGIEHVGAALDQTSDVIHRRNAQKEISQTFGQIAQARALWNTKLKERLNDGSLDTDQFDQQYSDYVNKIGENLKTAEGKDFFNKSANRLGGTLMQNAITGKAQIAGQQAYDDVTNAVNTSSSTLMENPDQFHDIHDDMQTFIQSQDQLNPVQKRQLSEHLLPELAKGAVRGWMTKDPGDGNDNVAKQMLDKGAFDEYLNTDQKKQLYAEAKQQDSIRDVNNERQITSQHRQLQAQGNDYMDGISNRVLNGSYNLAEMQKAPLTFEQKEYLTAKVASMNKHEVASDPHRYNEVYSKIINDDITDRSQLQEEFKKGGLSPDDADKLMRRIDATPEGVQLKQNMKNIDKQIQGLNFKFGGAQTDSGAKAAYMAKQEMDSQEQAFVSSGKGTERDFYMNQPLSAPTHPLNILNNFRMSPIDQARAGAQEQIAKVNGTQKPMVKYSTSPTKEIPPPTYGPQQMPAQTPEAPQPEPQAAPPSTPGTFDRMKDNKSGGELNPLMQAMGLDEESRKKQAADNAARRAKNIAEEQAIFNSKQEPANPKDDVIRPGESIIAWQKRTGK